jgi:hypothetical protein
MVKTNLSKFINSIIDNDFTSAEKYLKEVMTEKSQNILAEDHDDVMSAEEMHEYIEKLWKKTKTDSQKRDFLKHVSKALRKEKCSEKDFEECAEKVCEKGKKHCDDLIHSLEKVLGITANPKKAKQEVNRDRARTTERVKKTVS